MLCLLLNIAGADVAGRISGMVSDPTGAFIVGPTVTLNNTSNGTEQTTGSNDQGQCSFPIVPIGQYQLEVGSPGLAVLFLPT